MYITNPEVLNQEKLVYCNNPDINKLLKKEGFVYLSRKNNMFVYAKTSRLTEFLAKVVRDENAKIQD